MITVIEGLAVIREHWGKISTLLAGLFCWLWAGSCQANLELSAKLDACEAKPPVVQYQTVTVTAKARQEVRIVYQPGSPCPDVASVNDSDMSAFVSQSQTAQASESAPKRGPWSVSLGGAAYNGGAYTIFGGGYWLTWKPMDTGLQVRGVFPLAWDESQVNRRPQVEADLTVRF